MPSAKQRAAKLPTVSLDDKWVLDSGRAVINGTQAIARVLLAQSAIDRRNGLSTAGYITGYRGSPLGNVDTTLWSIQDRLKAAHVLFQPGVNEDIAATAVRGTQQIDAVEGKRYDGVFAAWYGKGPGVDRSGDALKHGNYAGVHRNGGVLVFYGDDHAGKSSTVAHQSEQAVAASLIPSLYPSDVSELFEYGLLGIAMSRFSGSWVAIKCVNEVAEQTATVEFNLPAFSPSCPVLPAEDQAGVHILGNVFNPLGEEQVVVERRLPLVHAFVRANRIDRTIFRAKAPKIGIVTAGKSYGDVRAALALIGLDESKAADLGVSLYKVGCIWPLEAEGLVEFAVGHDILFVIEEKKSFLEQQIAAALINKAERPIVIGKRDENGMPLLSATIPFDPPMLARAIASRLTALGMPNLETKSLALPAPPVDNVRPIKRSPYFCSGCPHNRSTRIPDGSMSMTGIGCHTMANFVRPEQALLPTQMGGEGGNWIGLAPFTDTPHIFQNMGDGTYYHSGLLAIRAAVAAHVNITYKILYNDAVAMTGGQPVDGPISVAEIARQVRDEGVKKIVLLSDDPARHRSDRAIPDNISIHHRDELDAVQRDLRETPGCTVLIYEQTCAAEKRRRRKRKSFPDPAKRLFIAKSVCEACGDCSVQSTCVSLTPIDTAFGAKRQIDQSSCNKDYSCVDGFCPSFVTIYDAEPRKPSAVAFDESIFAGLADPPTMSLEAGARNIMIAGIGGTGVVTVGALIGMAAHIEGHAMSLFDMTGLSQKNGAVFSHVRIARTAAEIHTQRVPEAQADLLMAFDLVAALSPEAAVTLAAGRTYALANMAVAPTVDFQFDRDFRVEPELLLARLRRKVGKEGLEKVNATDSALQLLGDTIGANLFLVGVAAQKGLLPVGVAALEEAIRLNGVAVAFNLRAFKLGRLFVASPDVIAKLTPARDENEKLPRHLDAVIDHHAQHLIAYQDEKLATRYRDRVSGVRLAAQRAGADFEGLTRAVAENYARLLSYKDEYEVARLLTHPDLHAEIKREFEDGGRIRFNLAPPLLARAGANGRPAKREFGRWILPIMRILARCKKARGTWLDPFGKTSERRLERELISDYEALVERTLGNLRSDNSDKASDILSLVNQIRGFGPVKLAAIHAYREKLEVAERLYHMPSSALAEPGQLTYAK